MGLLHNWLLQTTQILLPVTSTSSHIFINYSYTHLFGIFLLILAITTALGRLHVTQKNCRPPQQVVNSLISQGVQSIQHFFFYSTGPNKHIVHHSILNNSFLDVNSVVLGIISYYITILAETTVCGTTSSKSFYCILLST